jgi:hypothetical protein
MLSSDFQNPETRGTSRPRPVVDYSSVDGVIAEWAVQHMLDLYTQYHGTEVRIAEIPERKGFKIGISVPVIGDDLVVLVSGGLRDRTIFWTTRRKLRDTLEEALSILNAWGTKR